MLSGVVPRCAVALIDLCFFLLALLAAYALRFDFHIPSWEFDLLKPVLPVFIAVRMAWYFGAGVQRSMVRYTSTSDARRIFLTVLGGSATLAVLNVLRFRFLDGHYLLPFSVVITDFMGAAMLLISTRIGFKLLHLRAQGSGKDTIRRRADREHVRTAAASGR